MKRFYFIIIVPLIMSIGAHQEQSPTEQDIEQKIAYLQKKFSHIQELVCIFESIADDIALLLETKNGVEKVVVYSWLVNNDLMRMKKNKINNEPINEKQRRLFMHAFVRLSVPQFAYLRTYIKLQNRLLVATDPL